jgi:predicted O-methyltransferase YrrM
MDPVMRELGERARGFMAAAEGLALYRAALEVASVAPIVELGSYCGKSSVYLGTAAREVGGLVFTVDHHRGSEEMQQGWDAHDDELLDSQGRMDSLPFLRATLAEAGLEETVIPIVGDTAVVGLNWAMPASMVFIDGGHGPEPAHRDYEIWAPKVMEGGLLAIHDVFPDPADGGRPPYEIFCRALESGEFLERDHVASLRVLERR